MLKCDFLERGVGIIFPPHFPQFLKNQKEI